MKQRMLWLAASTALGLSVTAAVAEPARIAQAMPAMLPAHEIATIVRSAGFVPISPAMRRGEIYVLRATGPDGREMRVTVEARRGGIVSAVPVVAAAPGTLPGEPLGPYEPVPGYIPPPGVYEAGPPVVSDRPLLYERRPLAPVPNVPQRGARVGPGADTDAQLSEPPSILREERNDHGLLPAPPERFPQRVLPPPAAKPAAKPAPVKRAAAVPPAAPPLPKPRPNVEAGASPGASPGAEPPPPPPAASAPPDARALPH